MKRKAVLLCLITPLFLNGCKITSNKEIEEHSIHNRTVESKLTPLSDFFNGYLFDNCKDKINFDNYTRFLENRNSSILGNPFNDDCVPISFNVQEPEKFFEDMKKASNDHREFENIKNELKSSINGIDDLKVNKFILEDGRMAQIMKFTDHKFTDRLKSKISNRENVSMFYDEYFFLHEIFHMTDLNYDKSLATDIKESFSDIGTVITISSKYNLDIDKTINLAEDVNIMRLKAGRNPRGEIFSSHYNGQMLDDFLEYLYKIRDEGIELKKISSFKEAEDMTLEISMKIDKNKRKEYANGRTYWEPGMKLNTSKRATKKPENQKEIIYKIIKSNNNSESIP